MHDHEKDHKDISKILKTLSDETHKKRNQYIEELIRIAESLVQRHHADLTPTEIVVYVLKYIGKSQVLTINSKNDGNNVKRAGNPQALFTFAIGGNIVSRGLTFENLLTFFFSRTVKNKLQQNTYIQRARMFGNRPYSKYFELCVPETLFTDWSTVFQDHEISLRLGRAGAYQHIQSKKTAVTDSQSIADSVDISKSERTIGEIFTLTPELEEQLLNHDTSRPLSFLEGLLNEGYIDDRHLPRSLLQYLREVARKDESDVLVVMRNENGQPVIQNIERYKKDGDPATITRKRGGIVHAILNDNPQYWLNSHFILPIRNDEGYARFLYKSNIGQVVLQNLRVQPPTQ